MGAARLGSGPGAPRPAALRSFPNWSPAVHIPVILNHLSGCCPCHLRLVTLWCCNCHFLRCLALPGSVPHTVGVYPARAHNTQAASRSFLISPSIQLLVLHSVFTNLLSFLWPYWVLRGFPDSISPSPFLVLGCPSAASDYLLEVLQGWVEGPLLTPGSHCLGTRLLGAAFLGQFPGGSRMVGGSGSVRSGVFPREEQLLLL